MYQIYTSDCMKAINESVANAFGGSAMSIRFTDAYKPMVEEDAQSVIERITNKITEMGSE